jgi:hypothetical protein
MIKEEKILKKDFINYMKKIKIILKVDCSGVIRYYGNINYFLTNLIILDSQLGHLPII